MSGHKLSRFEPARLLSQAVLEMYNKLQPNPKTIDELKVAL